MEPVEIDIRMKQNVDTESEKAVKGVDNINASTKATQSAIDATGKASVEGVKNQIEKTKESIQNLGKLVDDLKKKTDEATPGNSKQAVILDFNEAYRSLNNQKSILATLESQAVKTQTTVDSVANSLGDESKKAVDAASLKGMKEKMKVSIDEQKQLIKEITLDVKNLQSELSKDPKNKSIAGDLAGAKKALLEEQGSLAGMQRQQLELNNQSVSSQGGVISSLGKWAVGLFTVSAALETGKKIIDSTETTTHAFEVATEQASSGVDYFFKSIASGDWSNFTDGVRTAIQGAKDYLVALEDVDNKRNEQKIKSSNLDIKIGQARADSYSTDPKVVKEALKTIIALQTEKLTGEAAIEKQNYEAHRKKIADDNGWNEISLQNTIKYYSANKKAIEMGEKYKELSAVQSIAPSQGLNATSGNAVEYQAAQEGLKTLSEEAKKEGVNLNNAVKLAMKFGKVTFPQRNELADLLSKSQDAEAAINISNRRDKQRLVGIESTEEKAAAAAAKKASTERLKLAREAADAELKIDNDNANAKLKNRQDVITNQLKLDNLLEDGFKKKQAIIDDNHAQELLDVDKKAQELLEKQQKAEKLAWDKKGKKGIFKPATTSVDELSTIDKQTLTSMKVTVDLTYNTNKSNLIKELSEKYKSFDEKRREIDRKYNEDKSAIESSFSGDKLLVKLDELNQQHKDAIKANDKDEADSVIKNTELFIQLFGDMSDKSVSDIRKIASESEALFDYLRTTSVENIRPNFGLSADQLISLKLGKAEMKDIENQIKTINDQADSLETGFAKIGTGLKNIFSGSSQKAAGKQKVSDGQRKIDSGIPELVTEGKNQVAIGNKDQLEGLAKEKAGIEALQSSFQKVSFFAGQATSLLDAMSTEEGDAASSASKSIGAVMDVASSTMQGFQQGGPIGAGVAFVMSVATKIFASEKAHQAALKKLNDEKIAQQKEYNDLLMKQNALLDRAETIFGKDSFGQALGYAQVADKYRNASKNANADLSSATVQTGSHKTGLFGWGGEKADYSSLLGTYPLLIDGQGKLNKELVQSILDNKTLDDTSKKALKSALDYSKEYEDALKSLSDYLSTVFGSLGQDMMTSITDNLGNTKEALDQFADDSAKTIEKLMTDIAYSMFFADKFKALSDQVLAVQKDLGLTPEQQAAKEQALLADFYKNIGTDVTSANKFLQDSKDAAAKAGFDLWDTTRTGASKSTTTASQDSINELNGGIYALRTGVSDIRNFSREQLLIFRTLSEPLNRIADNTDCLQDIADDINELKVKGLKLIV